MNAPNTKNWWTAEENARLQNLRRQYAHSVTIKDIARVVQPEFPGRSVNSIYAKLYAMEQNFPRPRHAAGTRPLSDDADSDPSVSAPGALDKRQAADELLPAPETARRRLAIHSPDPGSEGVAEILPSSGGDPDPRLPPHQPFASLLGPNTSLETTTVPPHGANAQSRHMSGLHQTTQSVAPPPRINGLGNEMGPPRPLRRPALARGRPRRVPQVSVVQESPARQTQNLPSTQTMAGSSIEPAILTEIREMRAELGSKIDDLAASTRRQLHAQERRIIDLTEVGNDALAISEIARDSLVDFVQALIKAGLVPELGN
ncbi:uncharacterized protein DSM5745_00772 [Aspergillus mulundensis]|uniref:Uncharacterized protein n=1 Tax=Aspergillus mulundensis TaxID=1810919 RepID=A0A3D8T4I8_9EURO|nr:hypothetical protein DSM5745_00772 [Aspergillus mulundensis]RDW93450.1 hypothetical protein DSM5745_00772 [Aspergillus mulundensis]